MSYATIAGYGVEWLDLELPTSGVWTCRARLDIGTDDPPPLGATSIVFDTGATSITYAGTILVSESTEGTAELYIVGGAGKLRLPLPGDDYSKPPPRVVVAAILSAAGEAAGDLTGLDSLPRIEPVYQRFARRADRQLDDVCSLVGATWRMLPSGAVNAGPTVWTDYHGDAFVTHFPNELGVMSAEPDLPDVLPGHIVEGYRIVRARYSVASDGLSAKLTIEASE